MDITTFRWTFLKSQSAENFLGVTIQCFRHNRLSTNFSLRKVYHFFVSKFFSSHSADIFVGEPFIVLERFGYRKNFLHEDEISLFSVETPLSHSLDKFCRGTLLCFKKTLASKVFMRRRGAYSFVEKFFCFTGPKNFVSVKSVFQKFSGVDNKLLIKDGGCPVFASICLTHSTGKFCWILFNVSRNFGYWEFSCIKNGYH